MESSPILGLVTQGRESKRKGKGKEVKDVCCEPAPVLPLNPPPISNPEAPLLGAGKSAQVFCFHYLCYDSDFSKYQCIYSLLWPKIK